jgi:hydroxymethylglutaryl-CoA synthase
MSGVPVARMRGAVATYTVDHLAYSPSPPVVQTVIDVAGGGRFTCEVADAEPERIGVGSPVEFTFRRLFTAGDVHNYFWKARLDGRHHG